MQNITNLCQLETGQQSVSKQYLLCEYAHYDYSNIN